MKKILIFLIFVLSSLTIVYAIETGILEKIDTSEDSVTALQKSPENKILLKSRQFIPNKGINEAVKDKIIVREHKKTYVLLQFDSIPSKEEKKELEKEGITLLSYIPNKAWLASVPSDMPEKVEELSNIRAITEILIEDKISLAVKSKNYIKNEDGTINLSVMFFNDVNLDDASPIIEKYGEVVDKFPSSNTVKIITEEALISDIADEENIQWIDVTDKILQMYNDGNRENTGVNILQASPYDLSGINVVTSEWDGGWADITHDDLQGRVTIGDAGCTESNCNTGDHATHVAGTMLGNGTLSAANGGTALQWRGMAPKATLISYEWWDDSTELNNEYNDAINTYNASLSQNSWGYEYSGCGSDCSGGYDSFAAELDSIVRGSKGKKISQIWSAGNKRSGDGCDNGDYDCIGLPGTAKNVITVGATNSDDDSMTFFSSWGPTNDGRLKPEVTAPGCEGDKNDGTVTGSVWSTVPTDTYDGLCGTSMSAPTTSGVVALMLEEFADKGIYPLPSTIKAILIHTAKDLGNAGPDYSFGYGRINATAAVDMIKDDTGTNDVIKEESNSNGETKEFNMTVSSTIKVTLVWDDSPAAANANPTLVNDLDLVLIAPNGSLYYPWVLDPNNPSNAATTGTNTIDNVEQVFVENAESGIWTVRVNGSSIPNGPQNFSLVSDHSFTIQPTVTVKSFRDSSYSQEDKFFNNGENVFIQANVTVGGGPSVGNTVTADLILSDGTVEDSLTLNEVGNGIYRNSWDSTAHAIGVYLINVTTEGNGTGRGANQFHLYDIDTVSAYKMDWDNDNNDDYILENLHLIVVFDGVNNTDKSLLYIEQKDTNVSYDFASISDTDVIGRAEVTTTNMKDIDLFSFSMTEGENLQSAELKMKINIDDPASYLCSGGDNECQVANGFFYKDGSTPIECTSTYLANDSSQNTDCSFSTQQDGGKGAFMQCEYDVSDIPEGSTLDDVTTHINMEVNLWNSGTSGTFELQYFDCSSASYVSGETKSYPGGGGEIDFFSNDYASNFNSWWEQCSGTFEFRWFLKTNWVGPTDYDYLDMCSLRVGYTAASIVTILNATVQMKTEDVDYLVYTLNNFDNNIVNMTDLFVAISGSFDSVDDDRYHLQAEEDELITSLPQNQWSSFNSNYTLIYDNSSSDNVNENVLAFVRFNESVGISFQDVGLWHGSEGLRIRYNVTETTTSDKINYILAFTKGDWQTIDQWMSTIESGQFPSPNFLTSPSEELISITLLGFPVDFGALDGNTANSSATGNADDSYVIQIDSTTTVNVDIYKKGDNFSSSTDTLEIENVIYDDDKVLEGVSDTTNPETILTNTYDATPYFSNVSPSTNKNIYYWISIPENQKAGDYSTTFYIKVVETGTSP